MDSYTLSKGIAYLFIFSAFGFEDIMGAPHHFYTLEK